jgi:hypothetical protein
MPPPRATRTLVSTAAFLSLAACAPDVGSTSTDAERIVASENLRIGEADGAPEVTFGRIAGLARDPKGRMLVVDVQAHEVRVFERDGRYAFTFGREGEGPGELRRPCCPAFGPDGLLWIRDSGNRRYDAFLVGDTSAESRGQIRMEHGDNNRWVATTFDEDGSLIDVGGGVDSAGQRIFNIRFSRSRDDSLVRRLDVREPPADSLSIHEVPREVAGGRAIYYFHQPHGPVHAVGHGPRGEWAQAVSSRYAIAWRAPDGSLLRTITRDVLGPPLSAAERTRADSSIARDERAAGGALPFDVPERKPPIRYLYFDDAGRLWVERSVAEDAPREADVWSRDGTLVFTLEWPADVSLSEGWRGEHEAIGIARDELGVERVVRLSWE